MAKIEKKNSRFKNKKKIIRNLKKNVLLRGRATLPL